MGTNGIADEMIKFNGYPFLEKEDHVFNVPGPCISPRRLCSTTETDLSPSCESDEARSTYSSYLRYNSGCRNAAERHGSEWVPDRHERCSPDACRVHWTARSAVRNRYVSEHPPPEVVDSPIR